METPLRPFRAVRYVPERVGDLALVLGPADDVPTVEQAAALAAQHPLHCLHLEIPDPDGRSFRAAARRFRTWRAEGVLRVDDEPTCTVLLHRFTLDGRSSERLGVFLAASLRPRAGTRLFPHEGTSADLVERRERQLEAVQAHAGAVFAIWAGDGALRQTLAARIEQVRPVWELEREGERYALWTFGSNAASEIAALAAARPLVVADGHHRLEAARRYASRCVPPGASDHPAAWVPVHVVDARDPALLVRPIHRLVRVLPRPWEDFRAHLARHVQIVSAWPRPTPDGVLRASRRLEETSVPRALVVHAHECLEIALPGNADREPDAAIVDRLLLRQICAFEDHRIDRMVEYTPDAAETVLALRSGRAELAILLRPTPLATVLDWAQRGRLLPPKTTYFFPKLPQGIVFYDLADPRTLA
ncbi:MAG: DUF1015 family protein [Thermomicrobium sp.]|nr:DUF1015 family protein [Thermomicrobium sp.]